MTKNSNCKCNREEKCDATFYHGSKISGSQLTVGSLSNDTGDGKENWKKAVGLYQQNNNSACASPFLYVS